MLAPPAGAVTCLSGVAAQRQPHLLNFKMGNASLHAAVEAGDLARVHALVTAGADVEERQGINGPTPLFCAAAKGDVAMARYLVLRRADKEASSFGDQTTPLIIAARNGHFDVVRMLVEHRANREATEVNGSTSLLAASTHGHVAVVAYLLEKGCDVNHVDRSGSTPLHCAAYRKHLEVVQLLLRSGAKLHVRNKSGSRPIDLANHVIAYVIRNEDARRHRAAPVRPQTTLHDAAEVGDLLHVAALVAAGVDNWRSKTTAGRHFYVLRRKVITKWRSTWSSAGPTRRLLLPTAGPRCTLPQEKATLALCGC